MQIIYLIRDSYLKCIRSSYGIIAKIKYPNNKCVNDLNIYFFPKKTYKWPKGIWRDDQHYQISGKCKLKAHEISPHASQNDYYQKVKRSWMLPMFGANRTRVHCWWEYKCIVLTEKSLRVPQKFKNRNHMIQQSSFWVCIQRK